MGSNDRKYWVGFDLGGTKMLAVVYDQKFSPQGSKRKKTKGAEGAEAGVDRMLETIQEALEEAHVDRDDVGGIGVGCPGPLDLDKGIVLEAPNLGWHDLPLKDILEKKMKCPAVLANDVDAGTYGEYRFGAGQKGRCVLGVFPGTGIGGGCVYEGRLFRGKTGSCMEIGHMLVQNNGRVCGCGRRGCLETVASRLAIAAEAAMAAYRGEAPNLMRLAGTNLADIRSGVLSEAIKAGDKVVEQIVRNAAKNIGQALGSVINLLAPDIVILGGGLVEAMEDLFLDEVRKAVAKRAMASFAKGADIVAAELGDEAAVMGAAALAADFADARDKK
jgi:glucokinase